MIDWRWILEDRGDIYLIPLSNSDLSILDYVIVHYGDNTKIPSRSIGWEILDLAGRLDPVSCRLYRLVYGSLP